MTTQELFIPAAGLFSFFVIMILLVLLSRCSMYLKKILAEIKDLNKRLTPLVDKELVCPKCSKTFPESKGKVVGGKVLCPLCAANDVTVTMG